MSWVTLLKSVASVQTKTWIKNTLGALTYLDPVGFDGRIKTDLSTLRNKINRYYNRHPELKKQYAAELGYINQHSQVDNPFSFIFPYSFHEQYQLEKIMVHKDESCGLLYVMYCGHRLYFSRKYNTEALVQAVHAGNLVEQDPVSPHRYLSSDFDVESGDVVVDIGAADGNFSLQVVERAKAIYIFETDPDWVEALQFTFAPWKQKVHVIPKYVSTLNNQKSTTLSAALTHEAVQFIKMDVEGAEPDILGNARNIIQQNSRLKLAICTYHRTHHAYELEKFLTDMHFDCHFSEGYMLFLYSRLVPPYFRRGILRAQKG